MPKILIAIEAKAGLTHTLQLPQQRVTDNYGEREMLNAYDTHACTSEQDYGPWLDRVSLFEVNGEIFLLEEYGYSKPYDKAWYRLSEKPKKTLQEAFGSWNGGGFCGTGDPGMFEDELEVSLTECEQPM